MMIKKQTLLFELRWGRRGLFACCPGFLKPYTLQLLALIYLDRSERESELRLSL